jgi:hypothetical protein
MAADFQVGQDVRVCASWSILFGKTGVVKVVLQTAPDALHAITVGTVTQVYYGRELEAVEVQR